MKIIAVTGGSGCGKTFFTNLLVERLEKKTTVLPLGPRVIFTALARVSIPFNILVLASVSNFIIFAILFFSFRDSHNV